MMIDHEMEDFGMLGHDMAKFKFARIVRTLSTTTPLDLYILFLDATEKEMKEWMEDNNMVRHAALNDFVNGLKEIKAMGIRRKCDEEYDLDIQDDMLEALADLVIETARKMNE